MQRFLITLCSLLVLSQVDPASASKGVFAEAISYTKPVPGGKLFVMLGDPQSEEKATAQKSDVAKRLSELRTRYPKSGLYVEATAEPLWQLPDTVFSPIDGTFLSDDGRYLVRIEGEWWRTKDFPGGKRPADEIEQQQLSATAISFFDQGKLLNSYSLKAILHDPKLVMHSPEHLLWYASGSLNSDTGRYLLFTQDSGRVVFDYRTGEILSRSVVGLSNPLFSTILIVCAAFSGLILLTWIFFVFIRPLARKNQLTS